MIQIVVRSRLRHLLRRVARSEVVALVAVLLVVLTVGALGMHYAEENVSIEDGFWWAIVTGTSTGYGDLYPTTREGRAAAVFVMLVGIGLTGAVTALLTGWLLARRERKLRGMDSYDFTGHYIVCHWNAQAPRIVAEIRADARAAENPIVIIAERETHPLPDVPEVHFVRGHVTQETLRRAHLDGAAHILILGDDTKTDAATRDAENVLAALVVERANPEVHSIVELADSDNEIHCRHAHVDEIIVTSRFNTQLISRAMLDPGVSAIFAEMLTSAGHTVIRRPVPRELAGRPYLEVFRAFKERYNDTALGVESAREGRILANPPGAHIVQADDHLIVLCDD